MVNTQVLKGEKSMKRRIKLVKSNFTNNLSDKKPAHDADSQNLVVIRDNLIRAPPAPLILT